jgi:solute carrier family 25 (mitochondrial citrate transporter), member 1
MPKNEVTAVQHTCMGGLAGLIEVAVMQPTVMVKNCLQEGRPFPTNPLTYYRGVFINCGAMGPIIATQFGVNNAIEGLVRPLRPNGKLTNADTIGMAMMAGISSSFVGCPAVGIEINCPWRPPRLRRL